MCRHAKLWVSGKRLINTEMHIERLVYEKYYSWLQDGFGFMKLKYSAAYLLKRTRRFNASSTYIGHVLVSQVLVQVSAGQFGCGLRVNTSTTNFPSWIYAPILWMMEHVYKAPRAYGYPELALAPPPARVKRLPSANNNPRQPILGLPHVAVLLNNVAIFINHTTWTCT